MNAAIHFMVKRPVGVLMSFLLALLLALLAAYNTPVSLFPDLDVPTVNVRIANEGKTSEEFENTVVQQFRNHLLQVKDLSDIYSVTTETDAEITLKFKYGTRMNYALLNVNEKIDQLLPSLPNIVRPTITKYSLADYPTLYLAVHPVADPSETAFLEASKFVENGLKNQLEQLEAVSIADVSGVVKTYYQLSVNTRRLQALGMDIQTITEALNKSKVQVGTIALRQGDYVFDLSLDQAITSVSDILELRIQLKNRSIALREVITVSEKLRPQNLYLFNSQPAISIAVVKDPAVSYRAFSAEVEEVIQHVKDQQPGLEIAITEDQRFILNNTIDNLVSSLWLGLLFALLSTLLFIRSFKVGLLLVSCVTVSLLLSVLLFYAFSISFNLISLTGLVLGVGLMIDNAIIVIDNISQKIKGAVDQPRAIAAGVAEVALPLLTSGFTTCSIFFPLFMISGLAGVLFYDEALSIAFCLASSLVVSLSLLPTLFYLLFKGGMVRNDNPLSAWYHRSIGRVDHFFKPITVGLLLLVAGGMYLGTAIELESAPGVKEEYLACKVNWNENITNEVAHDRLNTLLATLRTQLKEPLSSEIYIGEQDFYSQTKRKLVREFEALLYLKTNDPTALASLWEAAQQEVTSLFPRASLRYLPQESMLETLLNEEEYDLQVIAGGEVQQQQIVALLQRDFPEVSLSYLANKDGFKLALDEDQLAIYQIDKNALLDFVRYTLGGEPVYDLQQGKKSVPLLFNHELERDAFLNTQYLTKAGDWVLLKQLISLMPALIPQGIETINNQRGYVLNLKTNGQASAPIMERIMAQPELAATTKFSGAFERVGALQKQSLFILGVILLLLYLILAIQFDSVKTPLIVLFEVPICVAIGMIVLWASGQSLNIMSFIGLLMMAGIIINDSILKIDLINKIRLSGKSIDEAIHLAGERRLSSIIMTSLTTILAVSPMLFKTDISAQLQIPLITPIIAGLLVGTLISIFFIPLLYKRLETARK